MGLCNVTLIQLYCPNCGYKIQRFVSKKKENDKKSFPSKRPFEKENGRRKYEHNKI